MSASGRPAPIRQDSEMSTYDHFARFYDGLMRDPLANVARVLGYRERYMPDADSLLELGCGSGSILAGLHELDRLVGLDRSPQMLATARAKVPRARLIQADMTSVRARRALRHRDLRVRHAQPPRESRGVAGVVRTCADTPVRRRPVRVRRQHRRAAAPARRRAAVGQRGERSDGHPVRRVAR